VKCHQSLHPDESQKNKEDGYSYGNIERSIGMDAIKLKLYMDNPRSVPHRSSQDLNREEVLVPD